MDNNEKRLKYINDFFDNKVSAGFFYIEIIGCYFDENYIEHETYPYKFSFNIKDVQENEFEDVSDFVWRLEYTINDKYTNKKIEQYKYD